MSSINITKLDQALLDQLSQKERMNKSSVRGGRIRRNRSDFNRKR